MVNNVGLIDRKVIELVATHRSLEANVIVEESPASTVATIDINGVDSPDNSRLIITDASGNTVYSCKNPTFPFKWNLRYAKTIDASETVVPDGLYKVSVLVNTGRDYGSTPSASIIVLRSPEQP